MTDPTPRKTLAITAVFAVGLTFTVLAAYSGAARAAADTGKQCSSKACFSQRFTDCEAATYDTDSHAGAKTRFRIMGPGDGVCRIKMTYIKNPNPAWQGKSLSMALDADRSFSPQIKFALYNCMAHDAPDKYQCSGELRGINAEDADGDRNAKPEAVTEPPCGGSVEVSGEPLFAMPRNGRWGYVNRAGDWVIEPQWSQVEPFSEGRAVVNKGNSVGTSWGVIDRSGAYVVKPSIHSAYTGGPRAPSPIKPFSQGCAAVTPASGMADDIPYFITRNGRFWLRDGLPESLAGRKVKEFGSFSEGLAWFRIFDIDNEETYGYIDAQGRVAIDVRYARAGNFVGGLAPADIKNDLWGYIDPEGELVWPGKWSLDYAHEFSEGMAMITDHYGEHGVFDGEDIVIRKLHFDPPRIVKTRGGDMLYENPSIENAGVFANGLVPVTLPDRPHPLVYMDKHGNAVLVPSEDLGMTVCNGSWRRLFRHGLARLRVANENGKCDKSTTIGNGQFVTHEQSHTIYIDTDGQIVLEEPFRQGDTDARPQSGGQQS